MSSALAPRPALGIDIGGSSAKIVVLDAHGTVRTQRVEELADHDDPARNRRERTELVANAIRDVATTASSPTIGVATPGIVDAAHRRIVALPGKLAGLEGLDWNDALADTGLGEDAVDRTNAGSTGEPIDVRVLNDAHAAVLGELRLGAGRGARDVAMLTLGTGVGGGVTIDGRLFEGRNRRAGHLGHLSLDPYGRPSVFPTPGSLEWHVGAAYLAERTDGRFATYPELVAAVREGNAAAASAWSRTVRALAVGIASIVNVFDCERVILGGGLVEVGDLLFDGLAGELDEVSWRPHGLTVPVVPAELGRFSGSIGAALFGRDWSEEHGFLAGQREPS